MRALSWFSIPLFITAGALLLIGALSGEVEFGLFIIFPFILGHGMLSAIAILLLIAGVLILMIGVVTDRTARIVRGGDRSGRPPDAPDSERKYGGVVLIGPIPIAFGSDRRMAVMMLMIGLLILAALLLLYFLL